MAPSRRGSAGVGCAGRSTLVPEPDAAACAIPGGRELDHLVGPILRPAACSAKPSVAGQLLDPYSTDARTLRDRRLAQGTRLRPGPPAGAVPTVRLVGQSRREPPPRAGAGRCAPGRGPSPDGPICRPRGGPA